MREDPQLSFCICIILWLKALFQVLLKAEFIFTTYFRILYYGQWRVIYQLDLSFQPWKSMPKHNIQLDRSFESYIMYTNCTMNCNSIFYDWNENYVSYRKMYNRKLKQNKKNGPITSVCKIIDPIKNGKWEICRSFRSQLNEFLKFFYIFISLAGKCHFLLSKKRFR